MDQATLDKANKLTKEIRDTKEMIKMANGESDNLFAVAEARPPRSGNWQRDLYHCPVSIPDNMMNFFNKTILAYFEIELDRLEKELASL